MEKGFKYFLYIVSLALVFGVFYAIYAPRPALALSDEQEIRHMTVRLNEDLPRAIGTIGYLDSIIYSGHTFYYIISVKGNNGIKQIYTDNHDDFKDMFKYSVLVMNGQRNMGMTFVSFLESKGLNIGIRMYTPDKTFTNWIITGTELKEFVESCKLCPTETLHRVIEMHVKIANLDLPMKRGNKVSVRSVLLNSIKANDDDFLLHSFSYTDNQLIIEYDVDEKESEFDLIKENVTNSEYIEAMASIMTEDADVQEFFNLLAISCSDMVFRFLSMSSGNTVEITIPYQVIKKYCKAPPYLLS